MKKTLSLIITSFMCLSVVGQDTIANSYTFPVKPGDTKWMQMDSPISRILSIQIPDNVISEIPTKKLLELCLEYPYNIDVVFAENYQKGIEICISEFNGFRELLGRE